MGTKVSQPLALRTAKAPTTRRSGRQTVPSRKKRAASSVSDRFATISLTDEQDQDTSPLRLRSGLGSEGIPSLGYAFAKQRQYRKLAKHRELFVEGGEEYSQWVKILDVMKECMEQAWDLMIVKERFQQSRRTYIEVYSRAQVFENLFKTLDNVVKLLAIEDGTLLQVDSSDIEYEFDMTLSAIHAAGETSVIYGPCEEPHVLNDHERKYWNSLRGELASADTGKIVLRSWIVPGLSALCSGHPLIFDERSIQDLGGGA